MGQSTITGIIPPLVTPMTVELSFDKDAFIRLIEHVINGGVHGVFIIGSNGECASLTDEIRRNIIDTAVGTISNRVPVFVNISTSSYLETLQLADYAATAGADYIVLSPPYYFSMSQGELGIYFKMIADRSKLPLFLYNAPQYTKTGLAPETVTALALHDNIVGIKDSSGSVEYTNRLLANRRNEDFRIFIGPENILGECVLLGCDGGVNGGSNLFPELYVKMYQAASNRNLDTMRQYQAIINGMYRNIYEVPDSPIGVIIALKYALSVKGVISEHMAIPVYNKLSDSQKRTIDDFLKEIDQYDI